MTKKNVGLLLKRTTKVRWKCLIATVFIKNNSSIVFNVIISNKKRGDLKVESGETS